MTVERIRETIKVHIRAAEESGKFASAMALLELLDAIDAEIALERNTGGSQKIN